MRYRVRIRSFAPGDEKNAQAIGLRILKDGEASTSLQE